MAVTIKDVAKLANVSPSTVSRVIANNPRISEKTKEIVNKALKELGYHPNMIARSLAIQSTETIGLVMPSSNGIVFQNPFFPTVLRGLSEGAHDRQFGLHMTTGKTEEEIYEGVRQMVHGGRVDGVILLYSKVDDPILTYLQDNSFPFVVIGKPFTQVEQITHVDNDNYRASKEVTNYLIGLGHKRIAFVGGDLNQVVTIERVLGYESALREAGVEFNDEYLMHEDCTTEGGRQAVKELMHLAHPPTAFVVADDLMALGVLNTLNEMNIRIPDDVSVISFNNTLLAEMSRPPLTTVEINTFDLGFQATKSLIQMLENKNEPIKRIIIPHKLIVRGTCGAAKDSNIVKTGD
ncbi:LacI family DNA-binding transcriptional regulator [Bacillus horti]|uniref:DNA-binding LacI/PurR family transcriptional regulator n=1 Tax=Caldalkalibacillus horti TaxID=77523 RepID=A0ABT9W2N1_9BACI|nr:LacI family DNA-binding transcriptional regulator [Bacillus horti]MDQ0167511.1 DNA-binding LacI/PurR family transcriptional regulator [Bacillus horti]